MPSYQVMGREQFLDASLHISRPQYMLIYDSIRKNIQKLENGLMDPFKLFEATIWFLVFGDDMSVIAAYYTVNPTLLCCSIMAVVKILATLGAEDVPINSSTWMNIEDDIKVSTQIPNCIGILGAIRFKAKVDNSIWRKKSVTLYGVTDRKKRFILMESVIGSNMTFKNTMLYRKMSKNQLYVPRNDMLNISINGLPLIISKAFVADENFPQLQNLCVPYPRSFASQDLVCQKYNKKVDHLLTYVRDAFFGLRCQFRVLNKMQNVSCRHVDDIVHACASIHNFKINRFNICFTNFPMNLPLISVTHPEDFPYLNNSTRIAISYYLAHNFLHQFFEEFERKSLQKY